MNDNLHKERRLQAHRLRLTLLSVANTGLEAAVMLLYVWAGELSWPMWGAFVVACVGLHSVFALLIWTGWNLRLRDPGMLIAQVGAGCAAQIIFLVLVPQLAILFLVGVCVTYIFAMVSFKPGQFTWAWLLAGLSIGVALYLVRDDFRYPAVNGLTTFALWLYFFLAIHQLTTFGSQFSTLRMKLSERNRELSESLAKLEELAGQQRLVERERISRELHDTLLQGIQGLILRFQSAAMRIPDDTLARKMMDDALDQADRIMLEGRDQLAGLRGAGSAPGSLADVLSSAGEELMADYGPQFRFERHAGPRELQPVVAEEAYRIGREALLNAFQHARASEVRVELTYGEDELRLLVRDDGSGVDPQVLSDGGRQGHWGLFGMKERARRLGGRLTVREAEGSGTEVELVVPAALAYALEAPGAAEGLVAWLRSKRSSA
ncbi:sensor histidine kinase [Schlegelella sp. S2-27]|uniref:Sensor histidine kinase n=1 Tax=Caldimonas mangrovi TaxID=2944811 RepID=A0ABT0YUL0_9BURK|nr:sensor histidine kinase [Caldimonas mangrovi]MCM5681513.1 sensor histidine kinase [Caldimonas mangrovi]